MASGLEVTFDSSYPCESFEQRGLYKLAVQRADATEALADALAMLGRNMNLMSEQERVKLGYLYKKLAKLS